MLHIVIEINDDPLSFFFLSFKSVCPDSIIMRIVSFEMTIFKRIRPVSNVDHSADMIQERLRISHIGFSDVSGLKIIRKRENGLSTTEAAIFFLCPGHSQSIRIFTFYLRY